MNQRLGISLGMQVEKVKQDIEDNPDAVAVFVNNPTYYGICSDIKTIVQLAHARGMKAVSSTHLLRATPVGDWQILFFPIFNVFAIFAFFHPGDNGRW